MLTIRMATMADAAAIQRLHREQTRRMVGQDSRLPQDVMLPAWLIMPEGGACWLAYAGETLLAALCVEPEHWPPESPFSNVFPRRYLRMRFYVGDETVPADVVSALLTRADGWLGAAPDAGRMLLHPGCDDALNRALRAEGFTIYHTIAHQPVPDGVHGDTPRDLEIRTATKSDVNMIADLMMESWRFHAAHQPAIQLSNSIREGCRRQTRFMLGDGVNQVMLVAQWQDEIVGFFGIGLSAQDPLSRPALFSKGYYGDIHEVGVRSDQRRQGVGRAMYAAAWQWFKARHVQGVFVNYAPTNPLSSRFWPSLGFEDAWLNWWRPNAWVGRVVDSSQRRASQQ